MGTCLAVHGLQPCQAQAQKGHGGEEGTCGCGLILIFLDKKEATPPISSNF